LLIPGLIPQVGPPDDKAGKFSVYRYRFRFCFSGCLSGCFGGHYPGSMLPLTVYLRSWLVYGRDHRSYGRRVRRYTPTALREPGVYLCISTKAAANISCLDKDIFNSGYWRPGFYVLDFEWTTSRLIPKCNRPKPPSGSF
jgi:hypothetical protein